jgi:hypothetical protein
VQAETRRRAIAEAMRASGAVTISELEERFGVSPMPARENCTPQLHVLVPPNISARIELPTPDRHPIDVGSGTHHFQIPFRDPDQGQPP